MTGESRLDISAIDKGLFGLSDERPLLYSQATHPVVGNTLRDMHWELELGLVRSGRMVREAEGWSSELGPGSVWICGSWEPHGYRITQAPCEVGVFVVSPVFLARLSMDIAGTTSLYAPFAAAPRLRPQVQEADKPEVISISVQLQQYASDTHADMNLWAAVSLQRLLALVCRGWKPPAGETMGRVDPFGRIVPALRMAFTSQEFIGVAEAAARCGMSRNTFSSHFRRMTGLAFADFALRRRLRGAATALAQTSTPVKAIAFEWGFTDPSHLVKTFVRLYGCTPGQYRVRSRGQ